VLLLDEPTAALDPRTTRSVEQAISRLKEKGRFTMVIVTHDVEQSRRLGDRTVLLRRGRVVAIGESDKLIDELDPEERAKYLGELETTDDTGQEADSDE
jgi:ABC-type phosphate transport system ATPase subunit